MNLESVKKALPDLFPPLRLRSGKQIKTTEVEVKAGKGGLIAVVKTIYPKSELRRTDVLVRVVDGALLVSPVKPEGMSDALRLASLAQVALRLESPRCVKVDKVLCFRCKAPAQAQVEKTQAEAEEAARKAAAEADAKAAEAESVNTNKSTRARRAS